MDVASYEEVKSLSILREPDGDVSDWAPEERLWNVDSGSKIFAVRPGVGGPVTCEVWQGLPGLVLPHLVFEAPLHIEDPAGVLDSRLGWLHGDRLLAVFADVAEFAAGVQIVVTTGQMADAGGVPGVQFLVVDVLVRDFREPPT